MHDDGYVISNTRKYRYLGGKFPCIAKLFIFINLILWVVIHSWQFIFIFTAINIVAFIIRCIMLLFKPRLQMKINRDLENLRNIDDMDGKIAYLNINDEDGLPSYTVFIPLYKECSQTLLNLKSAISAIVYPKDKICIKLLCEADDLVTVQILRDISFPGDILIVPEGRLKTKGRALNYGLLYSNSEYIVVYDAEDIPDPHQLLLVVREFITSHPKTAVIQCNLRYYNTVNYVAKSMFIEYEFLFNHRNPFVINIFGFCLLGGTSNHFKSRYLQEVNGWDAENVTEDAEIAIEYINKGLTMKYLPVYTLEESVVSPFAWMKQRSRWIKGHMQTFGDHLIYTILSKRFFNPKNTLKHIWITCSFISSFSIPLMFIGFSFNSMFGGYQHLNRKVLGLCLVNLLLPLICEIFLYYIASLRANNIRKSMNVFTLIFAKVVLMAMHLVAYCKALLELWANPSYWDKTSHSGTFLKNR